LDWRILSKCLKKSKIKTLSIAIFMHLVLMCNDTIIGVAQYSPGRVVQGCTKEGNLQTAGL
jgi:hypothetical protein